MGMVNAGWADMGLHPDTFWLGYATAAARRGVPGRPIRGNPWPRFIRCIYGWAATNMDRLYQLMSTQAQFWTDSWDTIQSTARKGIWGNSRGVYPERRPARDQAIPLPPAPRADLSYHSEWAQENAKRLQLVEGATSENEELIGLLHENLARAELNRYTLSVFLSISGLYRQNLDMLRSIGEIDGMLQAASADAEKNQARQAVQTVDRALDAARSIQWARNKALLDVQRVWYKSWFPRVAEANGRKFLHEVDDVKDHLPDRTVDMSYLVYRELLLPFGEWAEQIRVARNQYAQAHQLPVRNEKLDWNDLQPLSGSELGIITLE